MFLLAPFCHVLMVFVYYSFIFVFVSVTKGFRQVLRSKFEILPKDLETRFRFCFQKILKSIKFALKIFMLLARLLNLACT